MTPFTLAIQSLQKNKLRVFLTTVGITIGIAMVIIVLSLGYGIKGLILEEISSFGNDWINIEVKIPSVQKNSQENATALARGVTITTLKEHDLDTMLALDNISAGYAGVTGQAVLSYGNETDRPTIFGVSSDYLVVAEATVAEGRFFTKEEDRGVSQVVVLGNDIKNTLFGENDAVGKFVKVDGKNYRVVGVMEELGATGFFNMDALVYIPLHTVQKKIMGIDYVLWIIVKLVDSEKADRTAEEITWIMRENHDITDIAKDDFSVTTQAEAIAIVDVIVSSITWLLIALAAVSLLVGGVGIMNIMYVSVVERTFEIGLRKAVGATYTIILRQFLIEAVVLTGIGGVMGVGVGVSISYVIAVLARLFGYAWGFHISMVSLLLAVGCSTLVGIIFGFYPARKAATVDAMVSLRQE